MSGGKFGYLQSRLQWEVITEIEDIISKNNVEVPYDELYPYDKAWINEHPGDKIYYYNFSDEVIEKFKEGIEAISKAYIYIQRIDWLLSDDDGPETFLNRLKQDLEGTNGVGD